MKLKKKYFPLFLNVEKKKVLVVGGGKIAQRRIRAILPFSFVIEVVAEEVDSSFAKELKREGISLQLRSFQWDDLKGKDLVLVCTNNHQLNEKIALEGRRQNILINRCDKAEDSDFWFPAIELNQEMTVAMVSENKDHKLIKEKRKIIKKLIDGEENL